MFTKKQIRFQLETVQIAADGYTKEDTAMAVPSIFLYTYSVIMYAPTISP